MGIAYYNTTGPVGAWIRLPKVGGGPFVTPAMLRANSVAPTFLGHCEKYPQPSHDPKWKPHFSSQTGEAIPGEKSYQGQEVKFALTLQRFDYDVLQALKAAPRYGRATAPGTESYLDRGALLMRAGLGIEVWLRNEFSGTANATPNLPIGTYYFCCNVAGIYTDREGRDAMMAQVLFEANWVQLAPNGNLVCYTQDPAFFPAATAIPG